MFEVLAFYKFIEIDSSLLEKIKAEIEDFANSNYIVGLVILAQEGLNGTVSGPHEGIEKLKIFLAELFSVTDWSFKNSNTDEKPFRDFRVKIRPEIVTTRSENKITVPEKNNHLKPEQWQQELESGEEYVLLDTRNWYETEIGKFKNALDPKIDNFKDFSEAITRLNIPKEKKVLMYCTGGIRCEKAAVQMQNMGFDKVFQLDGGILSYLQQFPHQNFQGECFVFDGRVAVDQNLQASITWVFCPHCGQPAKEIITCRYCSKEAKVCGECLASEENYSCSHNCSHHLARKLGKSTLEEGR